MKILAKITPENYVKRELGGITQVTPANINGMIVSIKEWARKHDGEIYEYDDMSFLSGSRGLCIVDSSGTILDKYIMWRS